MISSVTSGEAVRLISTGSEAVAGETRVTVKQLASNASLVSQVKMSGQQKITGKALEEEELTARFEKKIVLEVGGKEVTVDLNQAATEEEMVEAFHQAFQKADLKGISAKVYNGRLRLISDDPAVKVALGKGSSSLGLTMTGLSQASSSQLTDTAGKETGSMLEGGRVDAAAGTTFNLTLDGVQKTITLNRFTPGAEGRITAESIRDALATEVSRAFGDYVTVELKDGALELGLNVNGEADTRSRVTGMYCTNIGLTAGDSTHINTSTKLKELGIKGGSRYSFTINGQEFTFTGEDTVGTLINRINNSGAGVKLTYNSLSDTFRLDTTSTGAKYKIEISQKEGDLLGSLFGTDKFKAGSSAASKELTVGTIQGRELAENYTTSEASLKINVNGQDYTYTVKAPEGKTLDKAGVEAGLKKWLDETFEGHITYENGNLKINDAGYVVKFQQTAVDLEDAQAVAEAEKTDLALALGFNRTASSNVATKDTAVTEILQLKGVSLQDAAGNPPSTAGEIAAIEVGGQHFAAAYEDGRLVLKSSGSGTETISFAGKEGLADLFGAESLVLSDGQAEKDAILSGQDALISINGVETSRSTNSFTVGGITMELTKVSEQVTKEDGTKEYVETVIGTSRDVDKIVEGFQALVEEYNAMIEKINGYVTEESNYREYAPLTEAQKKEMTEREIELWEEKAKEGLLRRDSTLETFLSQMRMALYTKPAGAKYALYDIGIETTSDYNKGGVLQLDETALRNAISADPDAVRTLFTDTAEGLAKQLSAIMDGAAKVSAGSPGTLVQLAGMEGTSSAKNNTLSQRIANIESRIKDLKDKYEKEKERYWNQFNTMEQILASYNSQSMMISQQFSGY